MRLMPYCAREDFYKTLKTDVLQRLTSEEDLLAAH